MSNLAYFLCNRGFLLCCYCMAQRRWCLFDRIYAATMHRLIAASGCIAIVQLVLWVVIIVVTHAGTQELPLSSSLSLSLSLSFSLSFSPLAHWNSLDLIVWYRCIGLSCTGGDASAVPGDVTWRGL